MTSFDFINILTVILPSSVYIFTFSIIKSLPVFPLPFYITCSLLFPSLLLLHTPQHSLFTLFVCFEGFFFKIGLLHISLAVLELNL